MKVFNPIWKWWDVFYIILFIILNAVWIVPHTTGLRYACLFLGTLFIPHYFYQQKISIRKSIHLPIVLIGLFFVWVLFHYFFITTNQDLALIELRTIEKRALLGCVFAFGLATTLSRQHETVFKKLLFQIAILSPVAIFFFFQSVDLVSYIDSTKPYISKYQYVFFALVPFVWSMYQINNVIKEQKNILIPTIHVFIMLGILGSFYLINGKNGMLYASIASIYFIGFVIYSRVKSHIGYIFLLCMMLIISTVFIMKHVEKNTTWKYLIEDIHLGLQTEQYDNWKYRDGQRGLLENTSKVNVSLTTYERVAWFKEGIKLIPQNLYGYGLVQDSFKYMAKQKWPDSDLTHSHSGWLDLLLGFGLPGFICIFGALILSWMHCLRSNNVYARGGVWILPMMTLAFLTSELCEKGSFEYLLFFIIFFASLKEPQQDN